jgi:hypothetical protein
MMFGYGMPILFPIASISFLILYMLEKSSLYYSYKLPPMYDHRLNEMILRTLMYAPIIFLAGGYWMCSNKQIISNDYLMPLETV